MPDVDRHTLARNLCQVSLIEFIRVVSPWFIVEEVHLAIADKLEALVRGEFDRLMVFLSPRTGKSALISVHFPAWYIGKHPSDKIMQVSYNADLAVGFGREVRDLLKHPSYQWAFPGVGLRSDVKAAGRWVVTHGLQGEREGEYFASGVTGGIAGHGWHLGIIDDPLSEIDANSDPAKKHVRDWYGPGFYTRRQPDRNIAVIMSTRWAADDLPGHLLSLQEDDPAADRWEVIEIPAIIDHNCAKILNHYSDTAHFFDAKRAEAVRRKSAPVPKGVMIPTEPIVYQGGDRAKLNGDSFAPRRWPKKQLLRTKGQLTERFWSALYMQRPVDEEGHILKRAHWRKWQQKDPPLCFEVLAFYDTAFEEDEEADYTARTTWGLFEHMGLINAILIEAWRDKLDAPPIIRNMKEFAKVYEPDRIYIEKRASGSWLVKEARRRGLPTFPWLPPKTMLGPRSKGKIPRLHAASIALEAGAVWYLNKRWAEMVIDECVIEGTLIITDQGVKPVETIEIGDNVLTHQGRFRPVLRLSQRIAQETCTLRPSRLDALTLTPEHPVFAARLAKFSEFIKEPEWVLAGDLEARRYADRNRNGQLFSEAIASPCHATVLPIIQRERPTDSLDLRDWLRLPNGKRYILSETDEWVATTHHSIKAIKYKQTLDHRFGRLLGLYLAEGSSRRQQVSWSLSAKEDALATEICSALQERFGIRAFRQSATGGAAVNITANMPLLEGFFDEFGHGAHNKHIPSWVWDGPDEFLSGILEGYVDGDGCRSHDCIICSTVSISLAWGIRLIAVRLGLYPTLGINREASVIEIQGRRHATRRAYYVRWKNIERKLRPYVRRNNDTLHPIMETKKTCDDTAVYNMSVAEDESYCTTGGVVHNCAEAPFGEYDDWADTTSSALIHLRQRWKLEIKADVEAEDELEAEDDGFPAYEPQRTGVYG